MKTIVSILQKGWSFLNRYFAHRHAAKVAKDQRLADYEAFLLYCEQCIERSSPSALYAAYFSEGQALFRSRAAQVRRDFPDRTEFNRLDDALARMGPQDLQGDATRTSRDKLADAIRPLIRYVQSN